MRPVEKRQSRGYEQRVVLSLLAISIEEDGMDDCQCTECRLNDAWYPLWNESQGFTREYYEAMGLDPSLCDDDCSEEQEDAFLGVEDEWTDWCEDMRQDCIDELERLNTPV